MEREFSILRPMWYRFISTMTDRGSLKGPSKGDESTKQVNENIWSHDLHCTNVGEIRCEKVSFLEEEEEEECRLG